MMETTYRGARRNGICQVEVIEPRRGAEPLPMCLDVKNHSPTGFEWGYGGSGPAQLALAILMRHFDGDRSRALRLYQDFKWRVIAGLPHEQWTLTRSQIDAAIEAIEMEREAAEAGRDERPDGTPVGHPDLPF